MKTAAVPVDVRVIRAGKLRRYHGVSVARQLLDLPTVAKNIRDTGHFVTGYSQSLRLIHQLRPDIVFAKGGYVCLPIGLAAKTLGIPLVIHDSDTKPGLTNRVLARFAKRIATGSPLENYDYPRDRSFYAGVPIDPAFHPYTDTMQREAKETVSADPSRPLIVVVGGGLGAKSINDALVHEAAAITSLGVGVYHVAGEAHYDHVADKVKQISGYQVVPFVYQNMAQVLGAADIVISRASATFLQELAALKKPVIIVPARQLADQNKNAAVYKKADAAVVLSDTDITKNPAIITEAVSRLLKHPKDTSAMASRLHQFAMPSAATTVAQMIRDEYTKRIKD